MGAIGTVIALPAAPVRYTSSVTYTLYRAVQLGLSVHLLPHRLFKAAACQISLAVVSWPLI
jgi:hypothetical protein